MHDCMTQEDAINMDNKQAAQILIPLRDMMMDQHGCPISDAWFALGKAIDALSANQWIPCGEGVPEEYDEYLVTWTCKESHKRYIGILEYEISEEYDHEKKQFKGEWLFDDYMTACTDVNVIAWRPLPEPYQQM